MKWRTPALANISTNSAAQLALAPYTLGKWLLTMMKSNGNVM